MHTLRGESFLWTLLLEECLTPLMLSLDHINDSFEPLGEKNCVLSAAGFTKISLCKSHLLSLLLNVTLEPLRLVFVLICDARLG